MALNYFAPINLNKLEIQNAVVQNLGSAPGTPTAGQIYWDTTDDTLYIYDGTSWINLATGETYTAGAGLTLSTNEFSVNVSSGIEIASDSLRIATSAAGDGLSGGGGLALAVNTGSGLEIVSDNIRVAAALAGAGLTGGGGSALAVGSGNGISVAADAISVDPTAIPVDDFAAANGDLAMGSNKITGLADGTADSDAATYGQVLSAQQGMDFKDSVVAATTGNIAISTDLNDADTLDGVTLSTGDRVLVKDQTTASENGIYIVGGSPARAEDGDTWDKYIGAFVVVEEGTTNSDTIWLSTVDDGGTLGTTDITWVSVPSQEIIAGSGLDKTGSTLSVNTGSGIEVSSDNVRIAADAAGDGLAGGAGSALSVNAGDGLEIVTDNVQVDSTVARDSDLLGTFKTNVGDGTSTALAVTHNLGTRDVRVEVYRNSTPWDTILCEVERNSTSEVTLTFGTAPSTDEFRALVTEVA